MSKAHRCEVRAGGWETEPALFKEVIQRALHLGQGERSPTHTQFWIGLVQTFQRSSRRSWLVGADPVWVHDAGILSAVAVGCSRTSSSCSQALQMASTSRLNLSSLSSKAKVTLSDCSVIKAVPCCRLQSCDLLSFSKCTRMWPQVRCALSSRTASRLWISWSQSCRSSAGSCGSSDRSSRDASDSLGCSSFLCSVFFYAQIKVYCRPVL